MRLTTTKDDEQDARIVADFKLQLAKMSENDPIDLCIVCQNECCRWMHSVEFCRTHNLCFNCNTALPIARALTKTFD